MERRGRQVPLRLNILIIIDTSVLVSYEIEDDINHEKAVTLMGKIVGEKFGQPITTNFIFDETVAVTLGRSKSLGKAIFVGEKMRTNSRVLEIDKDLFDAAWKLFKSQKKSKLSFTDCTTVSITRSNGIDYLATFDKEFKQAHKNVIGL